LSANVRFGCHKTTSKNAKREDADGKSGFHCAYGSFGYTNIIADFAKKIKQKEKKLSN
jgi:hypothetical protein